VFAFYRFGDERVALSSSKCSAAHRYAHNERQSSINQGFNFYALQRKWLRFSSWKSLPPHNARSYEGERNELLALA
jgi:hypothetical protein